MKEVQWHCGQSDEEIRETRQHGGRPDQTNQDQRSLNGTDMCVAQRETYGDVTFNRHASQIQRRVFSHDESDQDEGAADRGVYFVDSVADDEHAKGKSHLDHVVDHQVNEEDVPRIRVEDLTGGEEEQRRLVNSYRSAEYNLF